MRNKIDINCDLGESYGVFKIGNDSRVMPHITSANIACGFHAGDPMTMAQTIRLARESGVAIGAHPGFPDLMGFGRREMQIAPEEVKNYTLYQISALQGFAKASSTRLQHVKLHGALYNMAMKSKELAAAMVETIRALKDDLIVFAQPKSALAEIAARAGLRVALEFFADRAYNEDGGLVSRKQKNAVIYEPREVAERAIKAVREGDVLTINGETLNIGKVHTICVHGDNPAAVKLAGTLRKGLTEANVEVEPVGNFI